MLSKNLVAALIALPSFAFAADLPSRVEPPVFVPPPLPPSFTWTGFYFGLNAGYAFDSKQRLNTNIGNAETRSKGFTGGGQLGYNIEVGSRLLGGGIVGGIEADAAYTRLRGETGFVGGGVNADIRTRTDFVGTARGRLGLAYQTIFVYGTGGFAYGGVRDSVNAATAFGNFYGQSDRIRTGYAYGGGVEVAIPTSSLLNVFKSSAVTVKTEFIHYNLGSGSGVVNGLGAGGTVVANKIDGNIARAGINYKFDMFGSAAPVVARY